VTPEDVARVVETVPLVHEDTAMVTRLYALLFERHPELRPMFPSDMSAQVHRFTAEIEALALAMPDLHEVEARASALGSRHVRYGVRSMHFPAVRDALLDVLGERLGDRFTPEHRQAWARAYNLLAEIMMDG